MKSAISCGLITSVFALGSAQAQSPMREQALRDAALNSGVVPLSEIQVETDPGLVAVGERLFESTLLSFNGETSCQTCHLDKFSSADGLPNAVGTGGDGEGPVRMSSGGDIVPRNTLPLWGRGSKGFHTFFWDGKVQKVGSDIVSQFGVDLPSDDPLVVAVHLPFVEIREMVVRDETVRSKYEKEDTTSADEIYKDLIERVKSDQSLAIDLSLGLNVERENLKFIHVAKAVAAFIRSKFAVTETRFNSFMFDGANLTSEEVRGGLIFFGKGQCSSCHNGPLMSDMEFHTMPFRQLGFGKNGFGVDYGRYNATLQAADTYKFRTPPLINVTKTAPYSHSGAYGSLSEVIEAHTNPLSNFDAADYTTSQRREYLARLVKWGAEYGVPEPISESEVDDLIAYLKTLETEE